MSKPLTVAYLKTLVHYSPASGCLTWLVTRGRVQAGDEVKSVRADGYLQIGIDGKRYMVHRVIWFYMTGKWPDNLIDHRDGDKQNNRWGNLRDATKTTNAQNLQRGHADSKHGLLGVSFIRGRKSRPYRAEIRHEGKPFRIGTFSTAELAHTAYLNAKRQLHEGNTL